jgi:hypothetical protein
LDYVAPLGAENDIVRIGAKALEAVQNSFRSRRVGLDQWLIKFFDLINFAPPLGKVFEPDGVQVVQKHVRMNPSFRSLPAIEGDYHFHFSFRCPWIETDFQRRNVFNPSVTPRWAIRAMEVL